MMSDDMPYAEVYDRLMEAEDTLTRVLALLDPHVTEYADGRLCEITKVHIRARDLRAALEPVLHGFPEREA